MSTNAQSLWDSILESSSFKEIDIDTFKDEGANTRISQYGSKTHGLFFHKNLLFQMADQMPHEHLSLLKEIPNRDVGGGETINFRGITFDIDYLSAIEEVVFLRDYLSGIESVFEIGAGYGRTCHSILSLFPNIREYHILDFPLMLGLSRTYLSKVSKNNHFSKVHFHKIEDLDQVNQSFDLIINIDSMQEMEPNIVSSYLQYINASAKGFYTKNTVGKFAPSTCGWQESEASKAALRSGILRNVINIFCAEELSAARTEFLKRFSPGIDWAPTKHGKCLPYSHFYQALYQKTEAGSKRF